MKAAEHPAYSVEQRRVTKICADMEAFIYTATSRQALTQIQRPGDVAKGYLAAQHRTQGLDLAEQHAASNPVRGRIDIQEFPDSESELYYIGLRGFDKDRDEGMQVVDWRAPIADLFYQADCGQARYQGPQGMDLLCTLLLRRGLRVEERQVTDIADLDVFKGYSPDGTGEVVKNYIADEFLTAILNSPAGGALKEIIGTIQREQHLIIKEPRAQALVLQAVAGSGKSTIALHRLAQILYDLRQVSKQPGQVAVFGPNKLLVHYVSQLLPSLLESDIPHLTFADWAADILFPEPAPSRTAKPGTSTRPRIVRQERPDEAHQSAIRLKGSLELRQGLDRYLERLSERLVPQGDIPIGSGILCQRASFLGWYTQARTMPYAKRWSFVADRLVDWAREQAAGLLPELDAVADPLLQRVDSLYPPGPRRRKMSEQLTKSRSLVKTEYMQAVTDYVHSLTSAWQDWRVDRLYLEFITQPSVLASMLERDPREIKAFCDLQAATGRRDGWDEADLGPLMYIYAKVHGVSPEQRFGHVVVDEGQDWSPMNYAALAPWLRDQSVTVVGDLAQGISGAYGLERWEDLSGTVFSPERFQVRQIHRSYRLTRETLALADRALRTGGLTTTAGVEALRIGEAPVVGRFHHQGEVQRTVAHYVRDRCQDGRSVAVIAPNAERAAQWLVWLAEEGVPADLADERTSFEGQISVLPVTLSKGLEFDFVAVVDADPKYYPRSPEAAKQLYVAITRSKQHVLVAGDLELSPLLM